MSTFEMPSWVGEIVALAALISVSSVICPCSTDFPCLVRSAPRTDELSRIRQYRTAQTDQSEILGLATAPGRMLTSAATGPFAAKGVTGLSSSAVIRMLIW
jgi:hypothetical protein